MPETIDAAKAIAANKKVIFEALKAAGITSLVVSFDGYGDQGQIEGIEAHTGEAPTELPPDSVTFLQPKYKGLGIEETPLPLKEAIEDFIYQLLSENNFGWENDGGAFGDFRFDVAAGAIHLEFNQRIETTEYSEYEF